MKAKIAFFIVWFIIIGGVNTVTILALSKRLRRIEVLDMYGIFSLVSSASFLIFCIVQWIRGELDIYQKTMTVILAITMVAVGLAALIDSM